MPTRLRRFVLYPLAAVIPVAGLTLGLSTGAGAATASASPSAAQAAAAKQAAIAAIKKMAIGQHGTAHKVGGAMKKISGLTQVQDYNWAGYADTGSNFSQVSANWTEPTATCGSADQLAAFWVGLDGYNSGSVEQDGTIFECYQGTAYHYTWWEMVPTNYVQIVGSSVQAGDAIKASVVRSGSSYTLSVTDATNSANSFTTTQDGSGDANSSAEWVAEAVTGSSGIEPLADFGTWTATHATAAEGSTSGTISSFADNELTMVNSSDTYPLATPSALNGGGNTFSVQWDASS